ncbi:MAG: hypothetical protein ACK4Z0_06200 [Sphingomonadaceae bacterium]
MPTLDGGHLYFTGLFPVRLGLVTDGDGRTVPWSHHLREELALLPTAQQNPETADAGLVSPFARCRRTHFARLVVIDQPMWGGRNPLDPILNILLRRPLKAQPPFDVLSRPWLLVSADIDRTDAPDGGLDSWAAHMWTVAEAEMRAIFEATHGFEGVTDAAGFARHLKRGQVETTMSFNGYHDGEPKLEGLTLGRLGLLAGGVALGLFLLGRLMSGPPLWLGLAVALVGGVTAGLLALSRTGRQPFPPFPDSDLSTVLKALHLQQRFARFAEDHQLEDPEALHRAFGAFLAETRPDAPEPAQAPGVIRSDGVALAAPPLKAPGETA